MTDLEQLEKKIDMLIEILPRRRYYTVQDICLEFGISRRTVMSSPWYQPNWGKSDFPGRQKKWLESTYEEWFKMPPAERKKMFESMSFKLRQKMVG